MKAFKPALAAVAAVVLLASAVAVVVPIASAAMDSQMKMPANAAEYTQEAAKYDQEAMDLDAKATNHAEMAKHYRARGSGGSKGEAALLSLAQHCERLAKAYSVAAAEARELATSNRAMAKAG
jgi:hypothetical protein